MKSAHYFPLSLLAFSILASATQAEALYSQEEKAAQPKPAVTAVAQEPSPSPFRGGYATRRGKLNIDI